MSEADKLSDAELAAVDMRLGDLKVVGGEALLGRTLERFHAHLALALADGEAGWSTSYAHRTAGLAGMVGYERLAAACRAVELAEPANAALIAEAALQAVLAQNDLRRRQLELGQAT